MPGRDATRRPGANHIPDLVTATLPRACNVLTPRNVAALGRQPGADEDGSPYLVSGLPGRRAKIETTCLDGVPAKGVVRFAARCES